MTDLLSFVNRMDSPVIKFKLFGLVMVIPIMFRTASIRPSNPSQKYHVARVLDGLNRIVPRLACALSPSSLMSRATLDAVKSLAKVGECLIYSSKL